MQIIMINNTNNLISATLKIISPGFEDLNNNLELIIISDQI